jgi:hypothetical protein
VKLNRHTGSTTRLLSLCVGYFVFYAIVTLTVKWFSRAGIKEVAFLLYQLAGGMGLSLGLSLVLGWTRIRSMGSFRLGALRLPFEIPLVMLGGITTAVIGVTTTLMYTLPTTIMVAMVLMRGGVIVIGRLVDAVQLRQGILQKQVYWEENVACLLGLLAIVLQLRPEHGQSGGLSALNLSGPVLILAVYLGTYAIRLYLLNYYKHTRDRAGILDQRGFFGIEQIFTVLTLLVGGAIIYTWGDSSQAVALRAAVESPNRLWPWAAIVAGLPFGIVGLFSFFLFTFRGRTATFASLVNRLTSLAAGTAATLVWEVGFGGPSPRSQDWQSLAAVVGAAAFLARAERRRGLDLVSIETAAPEAAQIAAASSR